MPLCQHHTLGDVLYVHPYVVAAVLVIGWLALLAAVVLTARAFAAMVRRHTRR